MPRFNIECSWTTVGYMTVEAKDAEEAKKIAEAPTTQLPDERDYLEDSFRVDNVTPDEA